MMIAATIRRLQVDLETPWPRHWAGGGAFRSAFFDALSFSFPAGEQLFIDAVRMGLARLDADEAARFADEVRGFVGQEATHRRVHERFNSQLASQGYVNVWEARVQRRIERDLAGLDARAWVGVTAATEHLTAVLAGYLLAHRAALEGAEPRLRDLWLWHSSEELEHRSTAFDLYRALGGSERWRRRYFLLVSSHFLRDLVRQMASNLWRDGSWRRWATWRDGWPFLLGRDGLLRRAAGPWRRYLRPDFHPLQGDGRPGTDWLVANRAIAPPVGH